MKRAGRAFVIVNPNAGNGRAARQWPVIEQELHARLGTFDLALTTGPVHASRLAEDAAASGYDLVIAVGGDGTLNEAVNGVLRASDEPLPRAAIGYIPSGTGCDFARSIGCGPDASAAIGCIAEGRERLIDVGRVAYLDDAGESQVRHFVNISSCGLSAVISRNINHAARFRRLPAKARYLAETIVSLLGFRAERLRFVTEDADFEAEVLLAVVANGSHFGGGMKIAPTAGIDDEKIDIVILAHMPTGRLMRKIGLVYRGAHMGEPEITAVKASRIRIDRVGGADGVSVPIEMDGETPGFLPAEFEILPRALRLAM